MEQKLQNPAFGIPVNGHHRIGLTKGVSFTLGALSLLFFGAQVFLFAWQSIPAWKQEGFQLISGTQWFFRQHQFGALPMIYGTVVVAVIAMVLAGPIGIGAGIFCAEYLPGNWRLVAKTTIELLAGIPSVVYGLLGILFLRDWVYKGFERFEPLSGDTLLTAGLLLAIMILPTVMTLCDDALRGVPIAQRMAARGLGMNQGEVVLHICLPQAWRGLIAAVLLGLGRALGEAIAVFLVVGRQDNQWPENLFSLRPLLEAGQTLTSKLASSETNIAYGDPLHWAAMASLGLLLLTLSVTISVIGVKLSKHTG